MSRYWVIASCDEQLTLPTLQRYELRLQILRSHLDAAAPAAVLARQFMTYKDLLSGVGDGAALEDAQLLMYPSGGSQELIERGSQSPRATS
jgi:hypothetical protein